MIALMIPVTLATRLCWSSPPTGSGSVAASCDRWFDVICWIGIYTPLLLLYVFDEIRCVIGRKEFSVDSSVDSFVVFSVPPLVPLLIALMAQLTIAKARTDITMPIVA